MTGGDGGQTGEGRQSAERVDAAALLDGVSEAVVALDGDGHITYANAAAADLLDRPASDLVGSDGLDGDDPALGGTVAARCRPALESGEPVECDVYCETVGSWLSVRARPADTGATVYVAERPGPPLADRAGSLDEQRLRAVFEGLPDPVMIKDREGRYRLVNGVAARVLDRPKSAILGRTDRELFGPEVGERVWERERAVLDHGRAVTYEETLPTPDGERVYETTRVPYYGPGGGVAGTIGVCRDVTDRERRARELRRYETLVETSPDAMFALDADLEVTLVNEAAEELMGYDRDVLVGVHAAEFRDWRVFDGDDFDDAFDAVRALVEGDRSYVRTELTMYDADGERVDAEYHLASVPDDDGGVAGVVGTVRDITDHKRQARKIRRQRDALDTLNRINELVHEIIGVLVDAGSRAEIEATVCERLAASDLYENAWIAGRASDGGVAVRTGVGADDYLDVVAAADVSGGGVDEALATGEAQVVNDLRADDRVPEAVRAEAAERGFQSCIIVPVGHGGATYGALVVNAARPGAFGDRERAAFEVLGEVIGFAVDAVQNRRLLLGDNLVEYRFRVTDSDGVLFGVADRLDCRFELERAVPADDRILHYVTLDGADPDDVLAQVADDDRVRDARLLRDDGDAALLELAMPDSAAASLLSVGARAVEVVVDAGTARVAVEAPPTVDVDDVIDAFVASRADTELVVKRDVGGSTRSVAEFRDALAGRLTDRQRAALGAAYYGGYFDWPRERTAEELADALGIASSTLHYHLRNAQRALLDAFFDE